MDGMQGLNGRQTLVTGAASPIGRAIVREFVEKGAMVVAVDATDDEVEKAIDDLGLSDADEVITRGLDDSDLGSWWDLANLIGAFYHELHVFVHIPQKQASESLPIAIDRLKESLKNADTASPGGVSIVVVSEDSDDLAEKTARDLAEAQSNIRVSSLKPGPPSEVAKAIAKRVSIEGSSE